MCISKLQLHNLILFPRNIRNHSMLRLEEREQVKIAFTHLNSYL